MVYYQIWKPMIQIKKNNDDTSNENEHITKRVLPMN